MRHSIHFTVEGTTADEISTKANTVAASFFGEGDASVDITTKRSANSQSLWEASVVVTQRWNPPKPTRKHLSAGATFEVHGKTLLDLVGSADAQLTELYGDEEFTYNLTITQDGMLWTAAVSSWLGSNDMGDF